MDSDIFRSSSPKEWSDFQKFVEKNKPFSVVIDGLNASYIQGNKNAIVRSKSVRHIFILFDVRIR